MTENTQATAAEADPRRVEWERRRKRVLPNTGGTYKRQADGSLPADADGNFVPEPDSVTGPPTGKSDLRRALYAKDLRENDGPDQHDNAAAQVAFNQAMSTAEVPPPRARRGSSAPADETPKSEG